LRRGLRNGFHRQPGGEHYGGEGGTHPVYAKLIRWLEDDRNAWAVTYIAIGIILYIAFIA